MRKNHQKQISELLKTLGEAHDEIKSRLLSGDIPSVMRLLSDCQDGAAQAGSFIEKLEGGGTKTVTLLEEYCESLYKTGLETEYSNANGESAAKRVKRLQARLVAIENSVKTELAPDRIEIAFIPYKASMWDALESVWLAAKDDPACDAYVIPAPYYDRMPDGSFGRMHYEGKQYPDYVPITDWRDYDFEELRPDMIFTHNPYDGGNLVTGIHPDFYCERLKAFTDLLVYIPYFVTIDDVPEHFCVCAGTIHANRVIVQSDKIRQTYIRVFKEFEKKNNCRGRFGKPETKFVALGSPKFDKVLSTKREDCEIPRAWRKLIEKPDGTRKHIIFYNTSIAAILESNERYLEKLRSVLDTFRYRDDVVLWWRPHPLNEATYGSMRPQLLREYESIVAEYRRAGLGIYDDTADLHRAIAQSDAYYGDWSSLVVMYGLTGKPMMVQNLYFLCRDEYKTHALFARIHDDGVYLWFVEDRFNALFRMSKDTWEAEYMGDFPEEKNGSGLYREIVENDGMLYFTPYLADEIAVYDKCEGTFTKIPYGREGEEKRIYGDFFGAVKYGEYIFFTPFKYEGILRLNTLTGEIDCIKDWLTQSGKPVFNVDDGYFLYPLLTDGHTCMLAACNGNAVVAFNTETLKSTVHEVGKRGYFYNGICFDGENYWLSPRHNTPIVKWNPKTGKTKEFTKFFSDTPEENFLFTPLIYCNGYVWIFPILANVALKINVLTDEVTIAEEFQTECEVAEGFIRNAYYFTQCVGDVIYAYAGKSGKLIAYNPNTGERREQSIILPQEAMSAFETARERDISKRQQDCKSSNDCIYREDIYGSDLDSLLRCVTRDSETGTAKEFCEKQKSLFREENAYADGTSSTATYAFCREKILGAGALPI
jgi:hypothetical protein